MPGYGIRQRDEGTGLLPWSWAEDRLTRSHDYWVASVTKAGAPGHDVRPHVMPVWGMWHESSLWFSSSKGSRKARNLLADPRCTVSTDDPAEPVVVEGKAVLVTDLETLRIVLELENAKYETSYTMEMMDPDVNACFRVRPERVFGLVTEDFTGSPTRWRFD